MSRKNRLKNQVKKIAENPTALNSIPLPLQLLAKKRIGGAINLRGINFQLLYTIHIILEKLNSQTNSCQIWMEGVEDIDVYFQDDNQLFQIKTSQNTLDANVVWNMKVMQNFFTAYRNSPSLSFCLVHNSKLAKGNLEEIATKSMSSSTLSYWYQKFLKEDESVTQEELRSFFGKVSFREQNEEQLHTVISQKLISGFAINPGTEPAFFQALFYWVFTGSKDRKLVTFNELVSLIESVKDSYSKFPVNSAVQNGWVLPVKYEAAPQSNDGGYYDGKAARPADIALQLPARRHLWEGKVLRTIESSDVTVIKSSSGQGKSTLAWQAGYELLNKQFSVYQVKSCKDYNEAAAISDFITGRLIIGEAPFIIVDGLSQSHAGWSELAKLIRDKPVKILITAREEDWNKYGEQAVEMILETIEISLSMQEAGLIYQELVKNNKVHSSIKNWEPVWEKVKTQGLMIEYIYLLTRGQMMADRLTKQVRALSNEASGSAKLEILRLITLADVLGIKVSTCALTEFINDQIGFQSDRNEVYRQLEKEYYLRFDEDYVEGLHPVRSDHLIKILHSHIPVSDSLISLLKILDDSSIYDFFINAPLLFESVRNDSFLKKVASVMALRTVPEMVYAIDGLMHYEPYRYWQENRNIFDEVATRGSVQLLAFDSTPFSNIQTIDHLASSFDANERTYIHYLRQKKNELTPYSIKDSLLSRFSLFLKQELETKPSLRGFEGITFLFKWFKKLGIGFPDLVEINEEELLRFLETESISESSDAFHFYNLRKPEEYKSFAQKHKEVIFGWIKQKTNSLTIEEKNNDIHINYLLDKDQDKANEYSVFRIQTVYAFFPYYEHYCTEAIVLPYPDASIYKVVVDNSIKRMPPENIVLGNGFDSHINRIWTRTILAEYGANSVYDWQKQYFNLRKQGLELCKYYTRLLEAVLEKKQSRVMSLASDIDNRVREFRQLDNSLKFYPSDSKKYFEKFIHTEEKKGIDLWLSSFNNFINQVGQMLSPRNKQDINLPLINIRAAQFRVGEMQRGFQKIEEDTYAYFDTGQLSIDESKWLTRLYHTVLFYISEYNDGFNSSIIVGSRSVEGWYKKDQEEKMNQLTTVLNEYTEISGNEVFIPTKIREDESLNYAVIGIRGFDPSNEDELWSFSAGLSELCKTDIHFFTFVFIDDQDQAFNATRFGRGYFEKFDELLNGIENEDGDWGTPLPVILDEEAIATLPGIKLKNQISVKEQESFLIMMFGIWKIGEYRKRLNKEVLPEKNWLKELEQELGTSIKENALIAIEDGATFPISREVVDEILAGETNMESAEVCRILLEKSEILRDADPASS